MLQIKNFHKSYPTGFELNIHDLEFQTGIHLIKGENGAGKSTLFKAIAGIHPFGGEIILNDISISKESLKYRMLVNYAEAEPQFPDFLSLDELITVVAEAKKASAESIEDLKNLFGVTQYSPNPIKSYSSGMLKKAALLLAFLGNPQLIILDEPFTTIDGEAQEKLLTLIRDQQSTGVNFLISSHHLPTMQDFAFDTVVQIQNGHLSAVI